MKFLLGNLLLGAYLLLACIPASCQPQNPYDHELEQLCSAWHSADSLERLVLLERVFQLRDFVDSPAALSHALASFEHDAADPMVAKELQAYLNDIAALEGRSASPGRQHWYQQPEQRKQVLAQANPAAQGAGTLELLAALEHMAGNPQADEHMLSAAMLTPSPSRWARAAAWTADPARKLSTLQAGLAAFPHDSGLTIQLASYYVGRQQLEKARALLQAAMEANPDDFVAAEHLAELYMNLGLRSASLRELQRLSRIQPAPLWLQQRLAIRFEQLGLLSDAERLASALAQAKQTDREPLDLLARIHERNHSMAQLASDYRALLRLEPDSATLWSKLAELQMGEGHWSDAKDSFLRAIEFDAANADAHRRLALVYRQLNLAGAERKELAAVAGLSQGLSTRSKEDTDAGLLVDPRALVSTAQRHRPQADDIALADIRIQQLYDNGLSRLHVQQVFYIGSDAAADSHRISAIRYSPGAEELRVIHARLWKPDGRAMDAQEVGESQVADGAVSMYYDMRSRQLRFPGLEKGDAVELEYELSPTLASSPYSGYFGELVVLGNRLPAQLKRYIFLAPADRKVFVHAEKLPAARISERNGFHTWTWELRDQEGIALEPRSPGLTETAPYVHVSTMESWEKLGAWYAELIRPQFKLDSALQERLNRLLVNKHGEREKIAAIQEFVLRSTHYVALEFGVYSYKPYPVSQTFARRFGDCKDKASLMIALLRAAGIDAEIALVRTRSRGEVAASPASIAVFDHAIVYLPKYDQWLDGTAEYSGRELPQEDQGALALTVDLNGSTQLRRVPVSGAADNYTKRTVQAELTPAGELRFSGSNLTHGQEAPSLRRELAVQERQRDIFRQRLAEVLPSVEIDQVAVHGADNLESDVSVEFQGTLFSHQTAGTVVLNSSWMQHDYLASLAPTSSRLHDLILPSPSITEEEIRVALPAGARVKQLPRDQELATRFGSVRLHYSKSAHGLLIHSRLEFDKIRIEPAEYAAFRDFCLQVEHTLRNEILVALPQ